MQNGRIRSPHSNTIKDATNEYVYIGRGYIHNHVDVCRSYDK